MNNFEDDKNKRTNKLFIFVIFIVYFIEWECERMHYHSRGAHECSRTAHRRVRTRTLI